MIDVKIEVKTKQHDDNVKKKLAETVENFMMVECNGKNLDAYHNN